MTSTRRLVILFWLLGGLLGAQTPSENVPIGQQQTTPSTEPPYYRVGGRISPPKAVYSPEPKYTKRARKAKIQGLVALWLVVNREGQPEDIKVVKSLDPDLDQSALDTVRRWQFKPALKDGKPVKVQITVEIDFRL